MPGERARLSWLQRLERIRALARQDAAHEAARAEGTLAQLEVLAERTRRMADSYRGRRSERDGLALSQLHHFVGGLDGIATTTSGDAAQARILADRLQQDLAMAERRRAAAEQRAAAEARALACKREVPAITARRPLGTALE